ncbi:hypothetical protein VTP01DRAFT_7619 [Rhizomucor pusillus]|uniref:mitochondrial 54S ribosomal bL33m domain-containing protein n=1 Tax=Rhizomucor pusillus TaxID=4840 RepID=UPI0037422969
MVFVTGIYNPKAVALYDGSGKSAHSLVTTQLKFLAELILLQLSSVSAVEGSGPNAEEIRRVTRSAQTEAPEMLPATTVEQEQTREIAREARNIVRLLRFESLILDREQQDTARSAQLPSRIYKRKEVQWWEAIILLHLSHLAFPMAKKTKARVILVKLLSTAGTGYNYVKSRPRANPKLSMMKFDPVVNKHVLFTETKLKR